MEERPLELIRSDEVIEIDNRGNQERFAIHGDIILRASSLLRESLDELRQQVKLEDGFLGRLPYLPVKGIGPVDVQEQPGSRRFCIWYPFELEDLEIEGIDTQRLREILELRRNEDG